MNRVIRRGRPLPDDHGTMPMLLADALYGLSHWPTVRPTITFLAAFPAMFSDTHGGKLIQLEDTICRREVTNRVSAHIVLSASMIIYSVCSCVMVANQLDTTGLISPYSNLLLEITHAG